MEPVTVVRVAATENNRSLSPVFPAGAANTFFQKNIPVTEATGISPLPDNLFGHPHNRNCCLLFF